MKRALALLPALRGGRPLPRLHTCVLPRTRRLTTTTTVPPPPPPPPSAIPPPPPPPAADAAAAAAAPAKKTGFWLVDYGGAIGFGFAISFLTLYLYRQKTGGDRRQALIESLEDAAAVCPGEIKELRTANAIPCVHTQPRGRAFLFICDMCGVL